MPHIETEDSSEEYFFSISFFFNLLHEFGSGLHSLSLFMFAIERYTSGSINKNHTFCIHPRLWLSSFIVLSIFVSGIFTWTVNYCFLFVVPTLCIHAVDFIALLIIILSSKKSERNYRGTTGILPLESRYQMSDVYKWSGILKRVALLSIVVKVSASICAWSFIFAWSSGAETYMYSFIYRNIHSTYTIALPFVVLTSDEKLRAKLMYWRKKTGAKIRSLDGKIIDVRPTSDEYFVTLKNNWR